LEVATADWGTNRGRPEWNFLFIDSIIY
jgi:hypothetical protein